MKFNQLSLLSLMVFESVSGLKNGQCDQNLCTCMIPVVAGDSKPNCPTWMQDQAAGPCDTLKVKHCCPTPVVNVGNFEPGEANSIDTKADSTGSGVALCCTAKQDFFKKSQEVTFPCEFDENRDGFNPFWTVKDGTDVLVDCSGSSQPPECLDVMPFDISPQTMAPNTDASSGGSFSNHVATSAVAVAALLASLLA